MSTLPGITAKLRSIMRQERTRPRPIMPIQHMVTQLTPIITPPRPANTMSPGTEQTGTKNTTPNRFAVASQTNSLLQSNCGAPGAAHIWIITARGAVVFGALFFRGRQIFTIQ